MPVRLTDITVRAGLSMACLSERDRGITGGAVDTGAADITEVGSTVATMIAGTMDADMIGASKDVDTSDADMKDVARSAAIGVVAADIMAADPTVAAADPMAAAVDTMAADRTADAGNTGL